MQNLTLINLTFTWHWRCSMLTCLPVAAVPVTKRVWRLPICFSWRVNRPKRGNVTWPIGGPWLNLMKFSRSLHKLSCLIFKFHFNVSVCYKDLWTSILETLSDQRVDASSCRINQLIRQWPPVPPPLMTSGLHGAGSIPPLTQIGGAKCLFFPAGQTVIKLAE
jgi:hypothetical protein